MGPSRNAVAPEDEPQVVTPKEDDDDGHDDFNDDGSLAAPGSVSTHLNENDSSVGGNDHNDRNDSDNSDGALSPSSEGASPRGQQRRRRRSHVLWGGGSFRLDEKPGDEMTFDM